MTHEQARFDESRADAEILHQHCAVGKIPIAVRWYADVLTIRQRQPAFLGGTIGPERRIDRVRNQPARRLFVVETSGLAQQSRRCAGAGAALECDLMQGAAVVDY